MKPDRVKPRNGSDVSHNEAGRGLIEEMESDSGVIWRVQWLHFNQGADSEQVNAEIARVAAGWEPFATIQNPTGGWALLLKQRA